MALKAISDLSDDELSYWLDSVRDERAYLKKALNENTTLWNDLLTEYERRELDG